jgi:hypothetical protein
MTGYGLKYYFVDKKIIDTDSTVYTYTFEILQSGYSGSSTEWNGISIKRNYEESDFRSINLLQKSSCTGDISVDDSSHRSEIISIAESEIGEYAVRLKRGSDVIWTGFVVPDLITISEQNYGNQTAKIVAKDILLRGEFTLTTTPEKEKAIVLIADILNTLGYDNDILSFTAWEANALNDGDDILNQVYHEKERFRIYGQTDDEEDRPLTLETALLYLLRAYGVILRQANGDWTLTQISAVETPSAVRKFTYDKDGVKTATDLTFQFGATTFQSSAGNLRILGGSTNNYFGGIKVVRGQFDHKSIFQGMKFNREYWFDVGDADIVHEQYWQADGTGNLSLEFNLWYANTASTIGNTNVFNVKIWVDTGTATDYYFDGNSWTTTETEINVNVPETHQTTDSDGNYVFKVFEQIITDPIPALADGQLKVEFKPQTGINDVYWYLRDIVFNLEYSDEIEGVTSAIDYSLTQTGEYNVDYDYGTWQFGQGPTSASLSALKKSDDTILSQWRRDGASTYTNHQELLLAEILDISRNNRRNLRAQLYGEYEPDTTLNYFNDGGTVFFFLGGSWDSKSYVWNVNAIELNVETATDDDLDTFYVTSGSGSTGGNAIGSSGGNTGSGSIYLEKSQNLSDLQNVATARDNLELGTGDDVTFNTVTADFIGDLTGAIHVQGKNDTGGTLTKGTPVYISGQNVEGQQFTIDVADSDGSGTMPSIGILSANVNNNAMGDIVTHGKLIGIDTSGFTVGDELFIGPSGTLVNTPPTGESNLLQKIAKVIRVDGSSGQIYIMGAGRTNAVPNLNEGKIFAGNDYTINS